MKTTNTLRITTAIAVLAGAGLSGCASDAYYDQGYSQRYDQPNFASQRNYGPYAGYYDPYYRGGRYYDGRTGYYYYDSPR